MHIRFVRYTSVTRTLVGRPLSVSCSVRMRYLGLPRRHSPPLRRLPSPDKHFLQIFCLFGVRYLYPFICDSTIRYMVLIIINELIPKTRHQSLERYKSNMRRYSYFPEIASLISSQCSCFFILPCNICYRLKQVLQTCC